jgi:hypothetical protein
VLRIEVVTEVGHLAIFIAVKNANTGCHRYLSQSHATALRRPIDAILLGRSRGRDSGVLLRQGWSRHRPFAPELNKPGSRTI